MTTQDIMSMLEVSYRVHGVTVFHFESVEPVDFLCVMRVVDRKLYAMKLESVAGRYFDTVDPEFDQLIASARLRK